MNHRLCALLLLSTSLVPAMTWAAALPVHMPVDQEIPGSLQAQSPRIDLSHLQERLDAKDWRAADAETRRILQIWVHPNDDLFSSPLATNVPPEVIQTLDQLWSEASEGRFGFSAQKAIWDEVRAQHPDNTDTATKAFGDRVGWTRPTPDPENFVSPDWLTEPELTYSLEALVGHLPWAGVDWERINTMLTAQSCGSCMIDAIYLQGERFNRYLPVLFNWFSTALTDALPVEGAWQQAHLARSINLRALYSNSNCPVYTLASAISPNSTVLAISSYSYERSCRGGEDNSTLALWNAERGTRIITLLRGQATEAFSYSGAPQEPPTESTRIVGAVANAIAFTPDGRLVAAGLADGTIRFWTTDRGEAVQTLSGHRYAVRSIAISTDGQRLASASADQTIKFWNLQTRELLRTLNLAESDGIPHTLLISADGTRLATATDRNRLQLWDAESGQLLRTLVDAADLSPGLPIAFSPDGQTLATADRDQSIKLWNATTGARIITLQGHSDRVLHLTFSPDSQFLASSEESSAYLWNLQIYQPAHSFDLVQSVGHPVLPNNLGYVAFSPDGTVLATSTLLLPLVESEPIPQQGITLWDVASGQSLAQIRGVAQFQFSPNGQFLLANGQMVQIWQPYSSPIAAQRSNPELLFGSGQRARSRMPLGL